MTVDRLYGILFSLHRGTPRQGEWVVNCLEGAWPKLLGDRLAAVCRPTAFIGSELVVEILDDNWEEAIRSVKPELQNKLWTATAGEVKTISLFRK